MEDNKSLDYFKEVIAAMLRDAHASHGVVFNTKALRLTTLKAVSRLGREGLGFLTKTLSRLGKSFDQALAGGNRFICTGSGFSALPGTELPRFLGEFYVTIFAKDGTVLSDPDAKSVQIVRQLLIPFGKLKLPYEDSQEQEVIQAFKKAEDDLQGLSSYLKVLEDTCGTTTNPIIGRKWHGAQIDFYRDGQNVLFRPIADVVRDARKALQKVFLTFNPSDIVPHHGPGAVATKQSHSGKFRWVNVCSRITDFYPYDEYFCSSQGHVCDTFRDFNRVGNRDLPARVILVPKDSRGPRLISCEPVDFQWVQGGLGSAIVRHVESHGLTKGHVNFTDQEVNRNKALKGSITGDDVTLDLKEASDRVHLDLVRLLFPSGLYGYLESCRSLSTVLPSGEELRLRKFAPMGSALCFPILALTIWSLLYAAAPDANTRKSIFVYGDDVIVPKEFSLCAMATLEAFGLMINRSKSCCSGFFRESCGMDAFKGVDVTPVRFRTVWQELPRPDTYTSYLAYANAFYDKGWAHTYEVIRERLHAVFGAIPGDDMSLDVPSLRVSASDGTNFPRRFNKNLQRFEYRVRMVSSVSHLEDSVCGWQKLLRFFSEATVSAPPRSRFLLNKKIRRKEVDSMFTEPFSVSSYTDRRSSMLVRRWR